MKRFSTTFITVLLSMAIGAGVVAGITWERGGNSHSSKSTTTTTTSANITNASVPAASSNSGTPLTTQYDFTSLYKAVSPSIVEITTGGSSSSNNSPFGSPQQQGLGSGIIIDTQGDILTNYHVVNGASSVSVTFSDQKTVDASVVGKDPGNDIALVKVASGLSELKPAKLGDSSTVKVGQVVAAIGNPFGLQDTFTTGVISGLDRTLSSSADGRPLRGLLQTDAAVNPGNSGGALINTAGEVVGINTAIENPGGNSFAGIAYAVPINTPKQFLTQLTAGQTITHARLGISGRTLTPEDAKMTGASYGVTVVQVQSGSAADQAGLQSATNTTADVITAIDGKTMKTFDELSNYIDSKSVGDKVTLTVHRGGKDIQITATLQSWDSSA